ncbi:SPW repeat protein [Roseomonas sp. E05]|uniref:SPW repeat protein n=1 Tax=Roseomonas sp. E05 TaxID=3046310 RepID=UPI0024BB8E6D|nr:SPW repeat protein [Roseomonas sp. E05]MDJ0388424.1 SPW repeat protein [Roseomonas sp. E05]
MNRTSSTGALRWASGINVVAGLWLIAAPFLLGYSAIPAALWNDIVCGVLIAALAALHLRSPTRGQGLSWTVAGIGAWLVLAPFILPYDTLMEQVGAAPNVAAPEPMGPGQADNAAFWNDIIVGVVAMLLGAWSATQGRTTPSTAL